MMLLIEIPNTSVNPVNMADNKVNVTNNAITLGNLHLFLSQRMTGVIIKYKKIENTNGTKTVFIEYNAKVAASNKMEEANFARIKGTMARQSARLAQIGTIASTGTSLLGMSNFGSLSPQGQFGSTANNSTFSNYS